MLIVVGLVIVLGSVVGGYLMAGGNLLVLNQPSEFIVIGGSAIGSLVISTPSTVLKGIVAQIKGVMGAGFTQSRLRQTCCRCCISSSSRCSSPA